MTKEYKFRGCRIPDYMMDSLLRYINRGIRPGNFLCAVLENDLFMAVSYADDENTKNIPAYIGYLYNEAPGGCWRSSENVRKWISNNGLEGKSA